MIEKEKNEITIIDSKKKIELLIILNPIFKNRYLKFIILNKNR